MFEDFTYGIAAVEVVAELHRTISDDVTISGDNIEAEAAPSLFSRLWMMAREWLVVKSHDEVADVDTDVCGDQVCA